MAILLFTDFGSNDVYVGQVEAVLDRNAWGVRVIHLLHEAPRFNVRASAHLLAALARGLGRGHVFLGVVDPGVGTERPAIVMRAEGNWYVGPDNGLFSVAAARATTRSVWRIVRHSPNVSASFHGRDIFAPIAAAIATGHFPEDELEPVNDLTTRSEAGDAAEVIYIDHFGNAFTGIRAENAGPTKRVTVKGRVIPHARVFAEVPAGAPFWYENSSALVEIAVNRGSAAKLLGLEVGSPIAWIE